MAQNRKNVAYIKLPCGEDSQKVKVTKIGKIAVICTQKSKSNREITEKEEVPKTVTNSKRENF